MSNLKNLIELTSKENKNENYIEVISKFMKSEVFFNVGKTEDGQTVLPYVKNKDNLKLALFYTEKENSKLNKPYAGMNGEKVFRMIARMNHLDGIVIENQDEYWVALQKETIVKALNIIDA
ncbi:SseB family protein [Pokkaliibacter sp. CJK22405]|uniref:SseB family protein n=1 Tax=Pokkaliibacter sp. CJK22405 TaxID=3384615 RepID=UPI0039853EFB